MKTTRRDFVRGGALISLGAGLGDGLSLNAPAQSGGSRPVVIAAGTTIYAEGTRNRLKVTDKAMQMLRGGADPLDAVVTAVNIVEDDPKDMSVGLGGLPNEDGEVELDASVMHGPTKRAGAVAAIKWIKNPSIVAKLVLERTDHVLLVGEGALRFALAHGFKKEDLLTEQSRAIWLRWKETMSDRDSWGPGLAAPDSHARATLRSGAHEDTVAMADQIIAHPPTGTITCLAVTEKGDLAGTTTTSGLAFKIAGRVGDSPLIGSGLFVDNEVGAAGSTGRGEECIKVSGSHTVVEFMRKGMAPTDACLETVKRVVANYNGNMKKLQQFAIIFYALNKNGSYGAAGLWGSRVIEGQLRRLQYVVHDGRDNKLMDIAYLYESPEK
ncbi:MAG TPA: N(4)-(beta-N-acetylglucosaminyl)-L-asparaginase [Blastocatellia bacterium]|nr:N(4)-(beta-N-acetylglucosaminyl)-L-asparaginase [Blastocatellia bacterium]